MVVTLSLVHLASHSILNPFKAKKVKIQFSGSGSGSGFDGWRGIVLCVLFLPSERCQYSINEIEVDSIKVDGCQMSEKAFLGNRFWRGKP